MPRGREGEKRRERDVEYGYGYGSTCGRGKDGGVDDAMGG